MRGSQGRVLLKSLGGSMGSYSGLQCHMKGSIYKFSGCCSLVSE